MDALTHLGVGFAIAQAGAKRLTKNWPWVIFLASGAPDGDMLIFWPSNIKSLDLHRHFTHSLAFAPILAIAVVVAVKYVFRRELEVRGAFLLALAGIVAHDLVDVLTYRGVRLLLPFSDEKLALKIEYGYDPVLYIILGLAFAIPFLSNLVNGEIGAKRSSGALAAWFMLAFSLCWFGARYTFHEQAIAEMSSRIYQGAAAKNLDAMPLLHPLHFQGLVQGDGFKSILSINLLDYFDPESGQFIRDPILSKEAGQALRTATASKTAQVFLAWAKWPHTHVAHYEGETRWVVVLEEIAMDPNRKRPRVVIRMDENYAIQSEVYERSKGIFGI